MDKIIKWGIAGTGTIADKFTHAIKNVKTASLVAVVSRKSSNAEEFAKKHNIKNIFSDYKMMAEFDGIDAIYIATPHTLHYPHCILFLENGKHILCEKPIAVDEKELQGMIKTALKNNCFLMEGLWTRFLPAIIKAKELVDNGVLGEIRGVRADFCYNLENDKHSNVFNNNYAGGGLLDVGIYTLNIAEIFLGRDVEQIKAFSLIGESKTDEHTNILIKYKNGSIANLSCATIIEKPADAYIYGSKGLIRIPGFYGATELILNVNGTETQMKLPFLGNGFEEEIIYANDCIADGKTECIIMSHDNSLFITRQMDMIREEIGLKFEEGSRVRI